MERKRPGESDQCSGNGGTGRKQIVQEISSNRWVLCNPAQEKDSIERKEATISEIPKDGIRQAPWSGVFEVCVFEWQERHSMDGSRK